ncbi:hypothetical protein PG994_010320 [Apiospora phragmitis]|uniref:Uncharacterized protein n=1 Tax=Apiospora phragmitis TaxID=2905665 RepID=A0ABR1TRU6_9PEZI
MGKPRKERFETSHHPGAPSCESSPALSVPHEQELFHRPKLGIPSSGSPILLATANTATTADPPSQGHQIALPLHVRAAGKLFLSARSTAIELAGSTYNAEHACPSFHHKEYGPRGAQVHYGLHSELTSPALYTILFDPIA